MVHTIDVLGLHDDAAGRDASVCFLDVFRYVNQNQIAFMPYHGDVVPRISYIPTNDIELMAYTAVAPELNGKYLAILEITTTAGRVYQLRVLAYPKPSSDYGKAIAALCSCSDGPPPSASEARFVYLKSLGTGAAVGGPALIQTPNLPATPDDGIWTFVINVFWSTDVPVGGGALPPDRGDAFILAVGDGNLLPLNTPVGASDNSIGETINAETTAIDGQLQLVGSIAVIAGQTPFIRVTHARTTYVSDLGVNLNVTISSNDTATLTTGSKVCGYAWFMPTSIPPIVL